VFFTAFMANVGQMELPFDKKEPETIQLDRPILEHQVQTLSKNYGISWPFLYSHVTDIQARHLLYGIQNISIPHEILIRFPQPTYVLAAYAGAHREKAEAYNSGDPLPECRTVEQLLAYCIDIGRIGNLKQEQDIIRTNLETALIDVDPVQKQYVSTSFSKPYVANYYQRRDGPSFLDTGYGLKDPRPSRLKQFFGILKQKYHEGT
jgi:hypothetical protein